MRRIPRLVLVSAGTALAAVASMNPVAGQTGDAYRGQALAQSWCATCHVIDSRGGGRIADMAPPFPAMATDPAMTPERLRAAMTGEHTRMPNFNLGRREVEDLAAYIRSLKPPPGR